MSVVRHFITVDDSPETISSFRREVLRNKTKRQKLEFIPVTNEDAAMQMISDFRRSNTLPVFFLDMNLTDPFSGLRILKAIRAKRSLKQVPVIIVSNSDDDEAISRSFELGANAYHVKGESSLIGKVVRYWIKNADDKSVLAKKFRD